MIDLKEKIVDKIDEIINDCAYYKKCKSFISMIENFEKIVYDNEDCYKKLLIKYRDDIKNVENKDLEKIWGKLWYFTVNNQRDYINKITNENSTIYEYEDHYIWYINNKKIDFQKEYKSLFNDNKIISIFVDDQRRSYKNLTKDDILYAKKIKVKVAK